MSQKPLYEELPYEDAESFVSDLSPLAKVWTSTGGQTDQNDDETNWIFRGQSNAGWNLSPTAMRKDAFIHYGLGVAGPIEPGNPLEQQEEEHESVMKFVARCIRAGLPIPEDSQWLRNGEILHDAFRERVDLLKRGIGFPLHIQRSIYALAQHHGVPTRLLDWSESPLVAAYFACRRPAEQTKRARAREIKRDRAAWIEGGGKRRRAGTSAAEKRLAVWALRQVARGVNVPVGESVATIEFVSAPYEANPNLRAQRGLFTLVTHLPARTFDDFRLPPTINKVIQALGKDRPQVDGPWLRKMTLPHSHAPHLLRLLDGFNVNASTIYPGYDSVTASIRERAFYG